MLPPRHDEPPTFLHRAVRVVAMIVTAYAALHVLQDLVALAVRGAAWGYFGYSYRFADRAIGLSRLAVTVLLLVGGIGVLRRKPWARVAVLLGMILLVVISFATYVLSLAQYVEDLSRAPTQPSNAPTWQMAIAYAFWFAESTLFPLLVWLILRQPEVARLFERPRAGGFEVVPVAQPVVMAKDESMDSAVSRCE